MRKTILLAILLALGFAYFVRSDTANVFYHTYTGSSGALADVITGLDNKKYQIVLACKCTGINEIEFKIYPVGGATADAILINASFPVINIDATIVDKITVKANSGTPVYYVYIFRVFLNQGN